MFKIRRYCFIASLFFGLLLSAVCGNAAPDPKVSSGLYLMFSIGEVRLLNGELPNIDRQCLEPLLEKIVFLAEDGRLVPFRTEIFEGHTLLNEVLQGNTIDLKRPKDKTPLNYLIPVAEKGAKIILHGIEGDLTEYQLVGLPASVPSLDFAKCIIQR